MEETERPLTLKDLPDLSLWYNVPLLTIEEAALLWGGIDPTFARFNDLNGYHPEQIKNARIAARTFTSAITLKTLTAHEIYINVSATGEPMRAVPNFFEFNFWDISVEYTTVMRDVLIDWAKRNMLYSLRQRIVLAGGEQNKQQLPKQTIIEYIPYKPRHENPSVETVIELSCMWDTKQPSGKYPKGEETRETIARILEEKTGEPVSKEAHIVKQIDAIARPPVFKSGGVKSLKDDRVKPTPETTPARRKTTSKKH